MNMIYNSPNYCVVEFGTFSTEVASRSGGGPTGIHNVTFGGGFEIMDKNAKREIFLKGEMAILFRKDVATLIDSAPSIEEIDDFLSRFDAMMQQPLVLH